MIFLGLIIFICVAYIVVNRTISGLFSVRNTFLILGTAATGTRAIEGASRMINDSLNGDMFYIYFTLILLALWMLGTLYYYLYRKRLFKQSIKDGGVLLGGVVCGSFLLVMFFGAVVGIVSFLRSLE